MRSLAFLQKKKGGLFFYNKDPHGESHEVVGFFVLKKNGLLFNKKQAVLKSKKWLALQHLLSKKMACSLTV
jgi:hypothetical protein